MRDENNGTGERIAAPGTDVTAEAELVLGWLAFHRDALAAKCAGLTADQLVVRSVPPSAMSLLGLVRHLTEQERIFNRRLRGLQVDLSYCTDGDPDGDFDSARAETADADFTRWRAERAVSDGLLAGLDFGARRPPSGAATVRWRVQKLLGEYARHNGHADLLREALDGATGE